jgi:hypothetical protein
MATLLITDKMILNLKQHFITKYYVLDTVKLLMLGWLG